MKVLPRTMAAVRLTGHGGMDKLDYRTDVPVPQPGADEVLVRIGAAAINNTDIWTREGAYNTLPGSSDAVKITRKGESVGTMSSQMQPFDELTRRLRG